MRPINCDWRDEPGGTITCRRCGKNRSLAAGGKYPIRNCPAVASGCLHLGAELRRVECPTCSGRVQVKVFGCELHGECTIEKTIDGVACCAGCGDYRGASGPQDIADRTSRLWRLSFAPDAPTRYRSYFMVDSLEVEAPEDGGSAFGRYLWLADCGDWQWAELRVERRADDWKKAVVHVGPIALCWSTGWLLPGAFAARQELHHTRGELPPLTLEALDKGDSRPPE